MSLFREKKKFNVIINIYFFDYLISNYNFFNFNCIIMWTYKSEGDYIIIERHFILMFIKFIKSFIFFIFAIIIYYLFLKFNDTIDW
jgi:hypothetical protein